MVHSFIYDQAILKEWQSSVSKIPVLLDLLKEKYYKLDPKNYLMKDEIFAYQTIYLSWKQKTNLNPRQKEWVNEIGEYLNVIQKSDFSLYH
ncbi:MAG: hypothetical protein JSR33_05915 [Proteobacteria bacterium]|nr:hypothetical protein [Pseudomonadota bacterium]